MAKVKLKPGHKSLHGRLGNVIHYNVYGFQYARSYSIPRNHRTEMQQIHREAFAEKVKLWQQLPPDEKKIYNRIAVGKPLSGYNIFISNNLLGITHGRVMELYKDALAVTIISERYQPSVTSVPGSTIPDLDQIYLFKQRFIAKKPPGIAAAAA
jgi:hypothetical protein